jgi:hypothetical protein
MLLLWRKVQINQLLPVNGDLMINRVTKVLILKIFSPKNLAKILAPFALAAASFCKSLL